MYSDPSAWYHYMCVWDTDGAHNATSKALCQRRLKRVDNYLKSGGTVAAANVDSGTNQAGTFQLFDQAGFPGREFEGYCAEMHFVDGTALDPTSFGEYQRRRRVDTQGIRWQLWQQWLLSRLCRQF